MLYITLYKSFNKWKTFDTEKYFIMKKFNILLANTSLNRQWHTLSLIIFNKKKKKEKLSIKTNNLRLTYIIVIEIIFSRNYSPELFDQSVFFHRIEYKHSTNDVVYINMKRSIIYRRRDLLPFHCWLIKWRCWMITTKTLWTKFFIIIHFAFTNICIIKYIPIRMINWI